MDANTSFFRPPATTIDYWNKMGIKPVSNSEIASLEEHLATNLPASYVSFMTIFGDVDFGSDTANQFTYTYSDLSFQECFIQVVGHIKRPERTLRYYNSFKNDNELDFPPNLLPFGMDLSQGELFIEFDRPTERIFYWDFDNHDWTNPQMKLGFVANNMYDFINRLKSGQGY